MVLNPGGNAYCNATMTAGGFSVHTQPCPLHGEPPDYLRGQISRLRNDLMTAETQWSIAEREFASQQAVVEMWKEKAVALDKLIARLADAIADVPGEPSSEGGAVDVAIRIIGEWARQQPVIRAAKDFDFDTVIALLETMSESRTEPERYRQWFRAALVGTSRLKVAVDDLAAPDLAGPPDVGTVSAETAASIAVVTGGGIRSQDFSVKLEDEPAPSDGKWHAPFTDEQVAALNNWQSGPVHSYTCGNDSSHPNLVPSRWGWHCVACNYTQNWSHAHDG